MTITGGTLIAFLMGLGVGELESEEVETYSTQHYWKAVFAIPILISVLQAFLLVVIFPYETPEVLKERNEVESLEYLMRRIYQQDEVVRKRIKDIRVGSNMRLTDVICQPRYRNATLMGCLLAFSLQLTGHNAFLFYGVTIFEGLEIEPNQLFVIISIFYLASLCICALMLFYFGRKKLMVFGYAGMALVQGL